MVIGNRPETEVKHVKFISYTGKYPDLCRGTLTLEVNGEQYVFDTYEKRFWSSGGECGFSRGKVYVGSGEWKIYIDKLPDELKCYADEIDKVLNDNVDWGCCGGCL